MPQRGRGVLIKKIENLTFRGGLLARGVNREGKLNRAFMLSIDYSIARLWECY